MKQYFKYAHGYINIDTENLFLTNTGNWQETRELKEKSPETKRKNAQRIGRMQAFVFTALCAFGGFVYCMFDNKSVSLTFIGLMAIGAYSLLNYFKPEFGNCYKIPLSKIESITPYEKSGLKISFRNEANEPDFEIMEGVDAKGITILTDLKMIKYDLGIE